MKKQTKPKPVKTKSEKISDEICKIESKDPPKCLRTQIKKAKATLKFTVSEIKKLEKINMFDRGHMDNERLQKLYVSRDMLKIALEWMQYGEKNVVHEHMELQEPTENVQSV